MIRGLALLIGLVLLPQIATAQTARVTSGEHQGFTRLVVNLPAAGDWQFGRAADGYELRLPATGTRFDLSDVFRPIGRQRLAAIWADPQSGTLRLGIACACHAIPFEFRPGIVVIDLRDGPPPAGSSFETALDGTPAPLLTRRKPPRPRPRPWMVTPAPTSIAQAIQDASRLALPAPQLEGEGISDRMAARPMRESLIRTLAQGAAEGVVDLQMPPPQVVPGNQSAPQLRVRLHDRPGMVIGADSDDPPPMTASGEDCVPDSDLDLAAWGGTGPVALAWSEAMQDIYGEFDHPSPEAASRAVRFLLWLGFGAEARQMAQVLLPEQEDSGARSVWTSIGHILDDTPDPDPAFRNMAACEGAAALWAALSNPGPDSGDTPNGPAIRRAFAALPSHLRQHLGPRLVERLRSASDAETVQAVLAATARIPGPPGPETTVMLATADLLAGDAAAAENRLSTQMSQGDETSPQMLVAWVDSRIAQGLPVGHDRAVALEAMLQDHAGTDEEAVLARALVLAQAASGDFDRALAGIEEHPDTSEAIWEILARQADDDTLLRHAVLAPDAALPVADAETRLQIARRLEGFGMAEATLSWLGAPPLDPALAARAALLNRDARTALRLLAGIDAPEAEAIRASAATLLGRGPRPTLEVPGAELPSDQTIGPAAEAPPMASKEPGTDPNGPLAASAALLDSSQTTRQAVLGLLGAVPKPALP
jgi:hypothetical protein